VASAGDVRLAMADEVSAEPPRDQAEHQPLRLRVLALWPLLLLPLLTFTGWIARRAPPHPRPNTRETASSNLRIVPVTNVRGSVGGAVFSPDERQIAFTWTGPEGGRSDLYVQVVGGETPLRLTHITSGFLDTPLAAFEARHDGLRVHAGAARKCSGDGLLGLRNADERRGRENVVFEFATNATNFSSEASASS
jgi:hypothetical protein